MFKIAKANLAAPFVPDFLEMDEAHAATLSQFTVSEGWAGDLSNGVIKLGDRATVLHGLDGPECGLLSMMRCYDPHDRGHILELFEQAATSSSVFCYSTTIVTNGNHRQPVFCIGESNGLEEDHSGSMAGIFVFPRFQLAVGSPLHSYA